MKMNSDGEQSPEHSIGVCKVRYRPPSSSVMQQQQQQRRRAIITMT